MVVGGHVRAKSNGFLEVGQGLGGLTARQRRKPEFRPRRGGAAPRIGAPGMIDADEKQSSPAPIGTPQAPGNCPAYSFGRPSFGGALPGPTGESTHAAVTRTGT
jgi:hypothetical protein